MNYFTSLLLLFLIVDGLLQTNAILMYLNINGSELKTALGLAPHAVPAASAGLGATKRPGGGHGKVLCVTFSLSSPVPHVRVSG